MKISKCLIIIILIVIIIRKIGILLVIFYAGSKIMAFRIILGVGAGMAIIGVIGWSTGCR